MKRRFLQVLPLTLFLVALFSIFTISPVSAATQEHSIAARPKIAQDGTITCYYKVTATAGLNARSGPGTNYAIQYVMPYGTIVAAYEDSTASGSGYTWRQLDDGNWAVTTWLQKTSSRCLS